MLKERKVQLTLDQEGLDLAQKVLKSTLKQHFKDTGKMDFKKYNKDEIENFIRLVVVTVAHNILQEVELSSKKEDEPPY